MPKARHSVPAGLQDCGSGVTTEEIPQPTAKVKSTHPRF